MGFLGGAGGCLVFFHLFPGPTTEIEADCDIKSSKESKPSAQSSQSHQLHCPEGTYHGEMTEVLLSSGAEGNQSKTSSNVVNGFFKGCLYLQALPNTQIIKSAYREKDGCALQG